MGHRASRWLADPLRVIAVVALLGTLVVLAQG
jgi:hypothetical protein